MVGDVRMELLAEMGSNLENPQGWDWKENTNYISVPE